MHHHCSVDHLCNWLIRRILDELKMGDIDRQIAIPAKTLANIQHAIENALEWAVEAPELLACGPMAKRLGVRKQWLQEEAKSGAIPSLPTLDGDYLFHVETVGKILAKRAKAGSVAETQNGG